MNEKKQKILQRVLHGLCALVAVGVIVILISKVISFLDGDVIHSSEWGDDDGEIIYENSDYILPLMITEDMVKADDGELAIILSQTKGIPKQAYATLLQT